MNNDFSFDSNPELLCRDNNVKVAKLVDDLIEKYEIQPGYGLAEYLDLPTRLSNYEAIRVWVRKRLNSEAGSFTAADDTFKSFINHFPNPCFH